MATNPHFAPVPPNAPTPTGGIGGPGILPQHVAGLKAHVQKIKEIMMDNVWRDPQAIEDLVGFGHSAGTTARLRDLRKDKFGGHFVDIRYLRGGGPMCEYRLVLKDASGQHRLASGDAYDPLMDSETAKAAQAAVLAKAEREQRKLNRTQMKMEKERERQAKRTAKSGVELEVVHDDLVREPPEQLSMEAVIGKLG